ELGGPALEDAEEGHAREAGKPVTPYGDFVVPADDVDVVPRDEPLGDRAVARLVRFAQRGERLVGEHDAPAVGVPGAVPLHDQDLVPRILLLHQEGEVEAGRPAADDVDLHRVSRPMLAPAGPRRAQRRRVSSRKANTSSSQTPTFVHTSACPSSAVEPTGGSIRTRR